jgi:hypothetical protein
VTAQAHLTTVSHIEAPRKGAGRKENLRAPGKFKKEDVEADESDQDFIGDQGSRRYPDNGDDELADGHPDGTDQKQVSTTHLLHEVQTWECRQRGNYIDC